jgi:PAS domain S-box-containing protein
MNPNGVPRGGEEFALDPILQALPGRFFALDLETRRLVRWGERGGAATGYSPDEAAAKTLLEWFSDRDRARVEEALKSCAETGAARLSASVLAKDGTAVPCLIAAAKVGVDGKDYIVGYALREREDAAAAERLLDERAIATAVTGPEGIVVAANRRLARLLGMEPGEAAGRSLVGYFQPGAFHDVQLALRRIGDGSVASYSFEAGLLRADGKPAFAEVLVARDHGPRDRPVIAWSFLDCTERTIAVAELERELERRRGLLERTRRRAGQNLQILASLMRLTKQGYRGAEDYSEAILSRIETMALIYQDMVEESEVICLDLDRFVGGLVDDVLHLYGREAGSLVVQTELPRAFEIDHELIVPLGLLVSELLRVFADRAASSRSDRLHIAARQEGSSLALQIVGELRLPSEFYDKNSSEASLIAALAEQVNGRLEIDDGNEESLPGTRFTVVLPGVAKPPPCEDSA